MKKNEARGRRSLLRRAARADRRRASAVRRTNVRKPSAMSAPWIPTHDNCLFLMAAGKHLAEPADGATDPLDALDLRFLKTAGWKRQPGPDPKRAVDVTIGMRRPEPEFVSGSGSRFVAFDRETYRGDAVTERVAFQKFWEHQINGRPFSMPFLKSGFSIWKKLGINMPAETTAYMMQMTSVDTETSEALQGAVWSTFNTSSGPIDIESVVFALANFIHADPLRKHLVPAESYIHPYGDNTQYGLVKFYKTGEEDGSDES